MQIVKLQFPKFGNFFSKFRNFISTIWKFTFQIKQKYFQKPVKSTFSIFCQKNIFFPLFGKNISIIFFNSVVYRKKIFFGGFLPLNSQKSAR